MKNQLKLTREDCFEIEEAKFNKLFLNIVDDTLIDLLGENAKKALYIYLETVFFLKRNDFINDLESFHEGLEKIFGSGAIMIENIIAKILYKKINLKFKEDTFINLMEKVKEQATSQRHSCDPF